MSIERLRETAFRLFFGAPDDEYESNVLDVIGFPLLLALIIALSYVVKWAMH